MMALRPGVYDPIGAAADDSMPWLEAALDPRAATGLICAAAELPALDTQHIETRVVRHKPRRRIIIEYHLSVRDVRLVLMGKARARGLDMRTYSLLRELHAGAFGADAADGITVPTPAGVIPELNMWLSVKAPGQPASKHLRPASTSVAIRLAESLHKLHTRGPPFTRSHSAADELRMLKNRLSEAAGARPDLRVRILQLAEMCEHAAGLLPSARAAGIHRDFYPDQVLIDGTRAALLDLDIYSFGDPALDAGNCIAHIAEQSLREFGDAAVLMAQAQAFERSYLDLARNVLPQSVALYCALALARHVWISTRIADRRHLTSAIVSLAESHLKQSVTCGAA